MSKKSNASAKQTKNTTTTTATRPTETTDFDIEERVAKGKESLRAKRDARKAERKEARAVRKESGGTGGGSIKHHKDGSTVYDKHGTVKGKTFAQQIAGLTLKEAKSAAKEESRQHRKPLYVNVTEKGDFEFSLGYDSKSSLHCYRNGSEVAMEVPKKKSGSKTNKQTPEGENSESMKTVKKTDRPAKNSGSAKIQKLTIKAIVALLKKGKKVRHERGFLPKLKNLTKKNQDLVWPVSVEA